MFGRILFPTDFSAYSNAVFDCLPELKAAGAQDIILLYVIRESDVPLPETMNRESLERVRWSAEELLHIMKTALEGKGLRAWFRIAYGSPAARIAEVAQEENVDIIVMGAQGSSLLAEVLLGSVAAEVLRRSQIPTLLLKFEVVRELGRVECRRVCKEMFRRVLFPTDFSDCAQNAFQLVKRLKSAGTREVIVLHVQDERAMRHRPPEQLAQFDQEDRARLERIERDLLLHGLPARTLLRHGIPFREVMKVAEEENPDLIVMGTHGRGAVQDILLGSTLESVVRICRHPVLAIPCPLHTTTGKDR
ncbi:MAG: universal stress protein [Anaerolineae bacterium]